jgi:Chitobiase/beta-hexosaminidase C-terminal domain
MKRSLLVILFFLFATASLSAQDWGSLTVDILENMNTSTPGTAVTTAILNAGLATSTCKTAGTCNWTGISAQMAVAAYQAGCKNLGPVTVNGGSTFAPQTLEYNSLSYNESASNSNSSMSINSSIGATSVSDLFCIFTPAFQAASGSDFDVTYDSASGGTSPYAVTQFNPKCDGTNYGVRIEVKPTAHSGCVRLLPQTAYFFNKEYNTTTGMASLYVYTVNGAFLGSVYVQAGDTGGVLQTIYVGNNENGTVSGSFHYFDNIMFNWSNAFPTGTVTATNGSAVVTGGSGFVTGNAWPNAIIFLGPAGSQVAYTIASVQSSSQLTLTTTFSGTTGSTAYEVRPPLFWTNTSLSAPVVAGGRTTDWTGVGVPGGIPNRTTACSTLTSSATSAQINSAISSCTPGDYVSLGAGTYSNATGCISFGGVSNVTLRGAGANQTFLAPTSTSGCGGSIGISGSGITGGGGVSGITEQGATTITVATGATTLLVGNPLMFDQLDPTCDNGGIFESGTGSGYTCTATAPGVGGPYNLDGGTNALLGGGCSSSSPTSCYHQQQIVTVTSCNGVSTIGTQCSGSNVIVGFGPGLHMPNWTAANMRAWWYTSPIQGDGVEDLSIDSTNNTGAIGIQITGCQGCWVKGVRGVDTAEAHVQLLHVNQSTFENNYFFLTQNSTAVSYGVECYSCTDNLAVNNIFQAVTTPMITNGPGIANAWVYNYAINEYYASAGNMIPARGDHASASQMNLDEGNIYNGQTADVIHGTGNMETFFRNQASVQPACYSSGSSYATAVYAACSNGYWTMQDLSFHRFHNYAGNVLGAAGVNTVYQETASACTTGTPCVYEIGTNPSGVPNDANVLATILRWGNADSATGFGSPRFNCSEIAAGTAYISIATVQQPYYTPCPTVTTLPASFIYTSKPSWWPSGKPWPIIGPDVTGGNLLLCNGGSQIRSLVTNSSQCPGGSTSTAVNGLAYSNPAMDCYLSLGGLPNGTGPQLTNFNEAGCYTGGTPQASTPMCAPGVLNGTYTSTSAVTVLCSTASSGAIMCYTTNGATPVTNGGSACSVGTLYATSILVSGSETVTIVAGGAGFSDSSAAVYTYIIQPAISAPAAPMLAMIGKLQ